MTDSTDFDFADVLEGAQAIGDFIWPQAAGTPEVRRRAYHLCEKCKIPAYKDCGRWNARKTRLRQHYAQLEVSGGNAG